MISMVIIGTIVSRVCKSEDEAAIHPDLIAPISQRFLSESSLKLRYYPVKTVAEECKQQLTEHDLKLVKNINGNSVTT